MAASTDRSLLAVLDDKAVMVVKSENAEIVGSTSLDQGAHVAWPRVAWSPSGKRIAVSYTSDVRVLDVEKGEWLFSYTSPSGPVAPNALSYPDEDYVLLDNHLLVHLPTKIQVCDYRDASQIETLGGTAFIGDARRCRRSAGYRQVPHPAAEKLLEKAQSDPSVFLVHPGVSVAIDVSGVSGQYQQLVRQGLEKAAQASGYKVAASAPIIIAGIDFRTQAGGGQLHRFRVVRRQCVHLHGQAGLERSRPLADWRYQRARHVDDQGGTDDRTGPG